ncbi:hypothetical protein SELR_01800 [Selenomonas ruminantium subsp. lactilytica TAM6421]|uniref:Uncharacterized protein n=1 Tax=Selenomonas ruminantium subsp. lactilytica (strain NBRC 103574 / TAM6421) TaxID=927704 RepID=I0GMA1_SELRL|nr:hypothetical protein SELR_01800 [Selenomonas ruminantium subsp. lactilytica TAM6421]
MQFCRKKDKILQYVNVHKDCEMNPFSINRGDFPLHVWISLQ